MKHWTRWINMFADTELREWYVRLSQIGFTIAVSLILFSLLFGCGKDANIQMERHCAANRSVCLYLVELQDGTRCAMTSGGGVDCHWKEPR